MKFLSVRELKTKSSQVWRDLSLEKEMIVTSNGKPIAILSSVDEESLEEALTLFRRSRAAKAVASIQYESLQKGTDKIAIDEIDSEIATVRAARLR